MSLFSASTRLLSACATFATTQGLGCHEYLQLAEDLGAEPVFCTKNKAAQSAEMQTLAVQEEERTNAYHHLRVFVPAEAYGIFEIAELRTVRERIENPTSR